MNLPTLIFLAAVIPFTAVAVIWLFAQALGWLAPRPRGRGIMFAALGISYLGVAAWGAVADPPERGAELALRVLMGAIWLGWGVHEYRRGEVGSFE
jgi:hypothetical protein